MLGTEIRVSALNSSAHPRIDFRDPIGSVAKREKKHNTKSKIVSFQSISDLSGAIDRKSYLGSKCSDEFLEIQSIKLRNFMKPGGSFL